MKKKFKLVIIIDFGIFLLILASLYFKKFIEVVAECYFYKATGLLCPTCGSTRMVYSILDLKLIKAFQLNQLMFLLFIYFGIVIIIFHLSLFFVKLKIVYISMLNWKVFIFWGSLFPIFFILRNIIN